VVIDVFKIVVDTRAFYRLKKITFLVIYALLASFFLVNGQSLFQQWDESWTYRTLIYIALVGLYLGVEERIPQELDGDTKQHSTLNVLIGFGITFIIGFLGVIILRDSGLYFTGIKPIPVKYIPANFIYQFVIVVLSEEIIWRGILYRYFNHVFNWKYSVAITAILFSIFHWGIYGGDLTALWRAFLLGIVFAVCVHRWNIGIPIGLHLIWNLAVLGIIIF
jgi:membrane protease YdiL (CAAX protease family)